MNYEIFREDIILTLLKYLDWVESSSFIKNVEKETLGGWVASAQKETIGGGRAYVRKCRKSCTFWVKQKKIEKNWEFQPKKKVKNGEKETLGGGIKRRQGFLWKGIDLKNILGQKKKKKNWEYICNSPTSAPPPFLPLPRPYQPPVQPLSTYGLYKKNYFWHF